MGGLIDFEREARWLRAIARSNEDPIPRSLALCVCLGEQASRRLLERLHREIELLSPLLARDREVVRLSLVGGTARGLSAEQRHDLDRALRQNFCLAAAVTAETALPVAPASAKSSPAVDVLGLGPGTISRVGNLIAHNAPTLDDYCSALDAGHLPVIRCTTAPP